MGVGGGKEGNASITEYKYTLCEKKIEEGKKDSEKKTLNRGKERRRERD